MPAGALLGRHAEVAHGRYFGYRAPAGKQTTGFLQPARSTQISSMKLKPAFRAPSSRRVRPTLFAAAAAGACCGAVSAADEAAAGAAQKPLMSNPLSLPAGIEPSTDPILLARPAAYAASFGRRAK